MSKIYKSIILLLSLSFLGACSNNNSSEDIDEKDSPVSSNYPSYVDNSAWGVEAARACYDSLETVIPYFESTSFKYESDIDVYGDGTFNIYLTYDSEEEAEKAYEDYGTMLAKTYGFKVNYTTGYSYDDEGFFFYPVCYMDLIFKTNTGIEIVGTYANNVLGLFCTTYLYVPEDIYPSLAFSKIFNDDECDLIPHINPEEDYTYSFFFDAYDDGSLSLTLTVNGVDSTIEEEFFNIIEDKQYLYSQVEYDEMDDDYINIIKDGVYPGYDYMDGTYFVAFACDYIGIEYYYSLYYQSFVVTYYLFK